MTAARKVPYPARRGCLAATRYVICQGICIEVVVKRVIAIFRIEADFDIVFPPPVTLKDFSNPVAEVALYFENEASDPLIFISCPVPKNLICVWVHAAACLAGADCAENCNAREKTPFWDHEPLWIFCRYLLTWIVNLP